MSSSIQNHISDISDYINSVYLPDAELLDAGNADNQTDGIVNDGQFDGVKFSTEVRIVSAGTKKKSINRRDISNVLIEPESFEIPQKTYKSIQPYITDQSVSVSQLLDIETDKTFVETIWNYISEKNLEDPQVYKAAQLDRRLFSRMMSDKYYKPSKDTAIALAFALKLSLYGANDLLERAGYVLSHSSKRDIVIEYFFVKEEYDINVINTILYDMDFKTLTKY